MKDDAIMHQSRITAGLWSVSHWDILQPVEELRGTVDMVLDHFRAPVTVCPVRAPQEDRQEGGEWGT